MSRQLRVAVIGAGPAGIYASDILTKSDVDVADVALPHHAWMTGSRHEGVADL